MKTRFVPAVLAVAALALTFCKEQHSHPEKNCDLECAEKIKADSIAKFKAKAPISTLSKDPQKAAENGLVNIKKLADAATFRMLGFESLEEVDKAVVGKAIPYHWLGCDVVLNKKASVDNIKALVTRTQTMYLVEANGKSRCGIMVEGAMDAAGKKLDDFGVASFGDAVYAKDYDIALKRFEKIKAVDESGLMLVNLVAAGIPLWATSLDANGYVLPFVSQTIPCLANFKEPVTWQKLFGALQSCKGAQMICQDTTFGVGMPTSPDEVPVPKAAQ